ncbi:MAG: hypothetical protein MRY72_00095 [Aquisalinus sp.]|nr:hypothetical protein [Aquisalinus sp.]
MITLTPHAESSNFKGSARSLRVLSEDEYLVIDLIPAKYVNKDELHSNFENHEFQDTFVGSRLVVQDERFLRVIFDRVLECRLSNDDAINPSNLDKQVTEHIIKDRSVLPFFSIEGSPWLNEVEDYQIWQDEVIKHYCLIGMSVYANILGSFHSAKWLPNVRNSIDAWHYEEVII